MSSPQRVFLTATEPSGDALGAELVDELRRRGRDLTFVGVSGAQLQARGVASLVDASGLQTVGFLDGVKALPRARRVAQEIADAAVCAKPDMVILIDSWGLSWRVAAAIKETAPHTPVIKYIGPQLWAHRPGRAAQLARYVDHVLCIFPFEPQYYTPHGLDSTVVGYPPLARSTPGDGAAFRERHAIAADQPVMLMLFGSRPSEVRRIAPAFEAAAARVSAARRDVKIMTLLAPGVADRVRARAQTWAFEAAILDGETEKTDAFAAADVALAVSGTVTTEVALQRTPVVVGYRIDWLSWFAARCLGMLHTKYITLMNVAVGDDVAPEYVQTRCRGRLLADKLLELLNNAEARSTQIAAQNRGLDAMGEGLPPPTVTAADAIERLLDAGPIKAP